MNFMLRFLLNLSITPLPAEELNEFYAAFLTEFVCHLLACTPEEDLCEFYIKSGVLCLLSRRSVLSFVPNL